MVGKVQTQKHLGLKLKHLKDKFVKVKGTVMQIEKALINDCLRVSNVS